MAVAAVAAVISYRHAYELVHSHGESGPTARLVPFTVDGLIWAASMVILDSSRRERPAPPLARWSLAEGIVATVGANVAHGASYGLIGAIVSAWPALTRSAGLGDLVQDEKRTALEQPRTGVEQTPEQAVLDEYTASLHGPGRPPLSATSPRSTASTAAS